MNVQEITKVNFEEEVINSKQTVLIDFWAPWCAPCRMMSPIIDEVANEAVDIKVVKINIDDEPEIAQNFGIMSIPTLVIVKDGEAVNRSSGVKPKDAVLKLIEA